MPPREGACARCGRATPPKNYSCRPCSVAVVNGREPYTAPCSSYAREPSYPFQMTCAECGFDSSEHTTGDL